MLSATRISPLPVFRSPQSHEQTRPHTYSPHTSPFSCFQDLLEHPRIPARAVHSRRQPARRLLPGGISLRPRGQGLESEPPPGSESDPESCDLVQKRQVTPTYTPACQGPSRAVSTAPSFIEPISVPRRPPGHASRGGWPCSLPRPAPPHFHKLQPRLPSRAAQAVMHLSDVLPVLRHPISAAIDGADCLTYPPPTASRRIPTPARPSARTFPTAGDLHRASSTLRPPSGTLPEGHPPSTCTGCAALCPALLIARRR